MLFADPNHGDPFAGDNTEVFRPNFVTDRIRVQSGWFTVHKFIPKKHRFVAFERNPRYTDRLEKLRVPAEAFASIRLQLNQCGINQSTLFPDIDNIARHIEWQFSLLDDEIDRVKHVSNQKVWKKPAPTGASSALTPATKAASSRRRTRGAK